ncbi:NADPH-dependent 7-cyano-7-deazaguanine reductase QueF [Marinimicrobium sp. ARAG 43.8]|uniref:NADPH-dependent 7-cyano-7-deazaguanine reductase QueF n=1 Tax=Marinimicrobium sp. ARAG 43.8 TaxID=3418719 RepID=UPI003CFA0618
MSESSHGPLGQHTRYSAQYDPELLFPIARAQTRAALGIGTQGPEAEGLPFYGVDYWTGYEISWLNERGKPQVALARFCLPCESPHLVESKSFKLYLNSFNLTRFPDRETVRERMVADLSNAAGATVSVTLTPLEDAVLPVMAPAGDCLDVLDIAVDQYHPAPELLATRPQIVEEQLFSHLLKSNCPVTGQPDWATVSIHYRGERIEREGLLQYIVSFREHQDFHEHCVERMFLDITQRCQPQFLSVYARYTRRGGLDINPFRCSEPGREPLFERLLRQ